MALPPSVSAMYTDFISTGSTLFSLDSCRRSFSPPMLTWITCRSVVPVIEVLGMSLSASGASMAVAHVAVHFVCA